MLNDNLHVVMLKHNLQEMRTVHGHYRPRGTAAVIAG